MSRKPHYSGATLLAALLSLMLGVALLAACGESVVPVTGDAPNMDLNVVPVCRSVDGAAPGQTYPCVWEEAHENARPYPGVRWVLYVQESCALIRPKLDQVEQGWKCIDVRDWATPGS